MQRHAAPATAAPVPGIDTSVIERFIGLSNPPDRIKAERPNYKKEIEMNLRAAVAGLPYQEAVEKVSQLDGLICLLALIALVEELKANYEQQLLAKYKLNMHGATEILEAKFEKFLDEVVAGIAAKKRRSVTQEEINRVVQKTIDEYWQTLIKQRQVNVTDKPDEEFIRLIKNFAFLVSASKVYRDTDNMQMLDLDKLTPLSVVSQGKLIIRIYRMPKEKMIESYQALARCADQLILLDDEKQSWAQLSVWLMGLYNRVYRAIDPKYIRDGVVQMNKGQYPTVDKADEAFLKHKGITKYYMSLFNRELSLAFVNKLGLQQSNISPLHSAASAAAVSSSSALPAASVSSSARVVGELRNKIQYQSLSDGSEGWCVSAVLPACGKDEKDKLIAVIEKAFLRSNDDVMLPNWLALCMDAGNDDKIKRLDYCISRFVLQPNQKHLLQFIDNDVKAGFRAYRNSSYILPMKHAEKSILTEERILEAQDPKEKIEILLLFRDVLAGENSNSLKKIVDKILLVAFEQLMRSMPVPARTANVESSPGNVIKPEISFELIDSEVPGARISVNVYNAEQRDRLIAAMDAELNPPQRNDEMLPLELAKCAKTNDDNKITRLFVCINDDHFELTPNQNELLGFIVREVKSAFNGYRNGAKLFRMTHDEESHVAERRIEEAKTPKEQLNILFELRNELRGSNSAHLRQKVDAILVSAYNQLLLSMPESESTNKLSK